MLPAAAEHTMPAVIDLTLSDDDDEGPHRDQRRVSHSRVDVDRKRALGSSSGGGASAVALVVEQPPQPEPKRARPAAAAPEEAQTQQEDVVVTAETGQVRLALGRRACCAVQQPHRRAHALPQSRCCCL